jgi:hypothetical protein
MCAIRETAPLFRARRLTDRIRRDAQFRQRTIQHVLTSKETAIQSQAEINCRAEDSNPYNLDYQPNLLSSRPSPAMQP